MTELGVLIAAAAIAVAPEKQSDPHAVALMNNVATCFVRGQRQETRAALLLPVGSPESIKALRGFARQRNRCMRARGNLRMAEPQLRVAMAEVAYRDEFHDPSGETTDLARPFAGSGNPDLFSHDIANCVVLRDPGGAHRVVHSAAGSSDEKTALGNVGPAISSCVPAGARTRFERRHIRGLLAQALYQARYASAAFNSPKRTMN